MDKSVGDLKMQICQVIPGLTLDSCLLLLGDQILENSKKLTCYNKSGRSRLVVGIYDKALITINVFLTPRKSCERSRVVTVALRRQCP